MAEKARPASAVGSVVTAAGPPSTKPAALHLVLLLLGRLGTLELLQQAAVRGQARCAAGAAGSMLSRVETCQDQRPSCSASTFCPAPRDAHELRGLVDPAGEWLAQIVAGTPTAVWRRRTVRARAPAACVAVGGLSAPVAVARVGAAVRRLGSP